MKKLSFAMAPAILLLAGCADPYGACVKAGADIATGIGQGMNTVEQLQQQGVISASEAANVLGYLEFANQGDEAFLACAQSAHTSGEAGAFTTCATTFNAALNNPQELALVKISNANAQATVSTIVSGVATGVATLAAALGGR